MSKNDNERLKNLQNQMSEMNNDFEDMKRTREEAKKQLEAKFLDIYKKINSINENMDSENKRVNYSLKAFESKFEYLMEQFRNVFNQDFEAEKSYTRKTLNSHSDRLKRLEEMIMQEKRERMKQTDEHLNPLRTHLSNLQKEHEANKAERLQHKKEIYRNLDDNKFEVNEKLNRENDEMKTHATILKENTFKKLAIRDNYETDFKKHLFSDIQNLRDELFEEMSTRFSHQNQIVDNLSNFIKTFQDTLKIVGKDD